MNQIRSVAKLCPTLCHPMNRSMPGLPVHHQLPEFTQTHVHQVSDAIQTSHPLSSPSPPAPNPSQHQSLFQWVNSLHEVIKVLQLYHHSSQRNPRAAVKVLHSICQQIWKTHQWPQDWKRLKRSVFIPIPKKGNAKECSNYHTVALISYTSKVMLKILQARLQQYVHWELPGIQAGFRKGRGSRDQIANISWITEKAM